MGYLLNEKKIVNDNIFMYEDRMTSPYSRFLESSPTFVTYYNINNVESTADNGFQDVERILGENSPLRYKEIKELPVYGIEQIVLGLSQQDQGLDTDYEGEGVILPGTIKPLPNDFFIINYLDHDYLFMVTEIAYDTIKSNNYYHITFTLRSMDAENREYLEEQTNENYSCVLSNIGTKEKCILRDDEYALVFSLNDVYSQIADRYKLYFFNDKLNSFIFTDMNSMRVYDKYLSHFINKFGLFNSPNQFDTLFLTVEDKTPLFPVQYSNTIYQALEINRKELVRDFNYAQTPVVDRMSIFHLYRQFDIQSVSFSVGDYPYVEPTLIEKITTNVTDETDDVFTKVIVQYFNGGIDSIDTLDMEELTDLTMFMEMNRRVFILVPILLYILRSYYNKFMSTK